MFNTDRIIHFYDCGIMRYGFNEREDGDGDETLYLKKILFLYTSIQLHLILKKDLNTFH